MALFHAPKICQWWHAPGLRGLAWSTTSREKNLGPKGKQEYGCCTNHHVGPE